MKILHLIATLMVLLPTMTKAQVQCGTIASVTQGCPPLTVSFTDNSSGNPNSYCWDFDNGGIGTSNQANVTYVFNYPGTYNVKHCVSDGVTSDSCYIQIHVFIPPTVNFTAPDARGCVQPCHLVHFQNQTTVGEAPITEYVWSFGDGSLPVTLLPGMADTSHCYNTPGVYPVTLVVRDSNTCQSSKTSYQVKIGNHPTVSATANPTQSCTSPAVINFTASGTTPNGGPVTYGWLFGNGNISIQQNPSQVFFNGIYKPIVVLTDTLGCTDTAFLNVNVTQVQAGFDTMLVAGACSSGIQFSDTSNFATTWLWNFGDGTTSTLQNPFHTYPLPGNYQVTVTVAYNGCVNLVTKMISVTNAMIGGNVDFSVTSSFSLCPPFPVQFYNSGDSSLSYFWDFGDSSVSTAHQPLHVYTHPGNYDVMLIVVDSTGTCSDTVTEDNFIRVRGPIGSFSLTPDSVNAPCTINLMGTMYSTMQFVCDMGDGKAFQDSLPAQYTYTQGGTYYPVITLADSLGCMVSYPVDTVVCFGGGVGIYNMNTTGLKIYPNPANEILFVELSNPANNTELIVTNLLGEVVQRTTLSQQHTSIDVSQLPDGLYVVTVSGYGTEKLRQTFIKQ